MATTFTYAAALEALDRALKFGINPSLDGIRSLVAAMEHPDRAFHSAQVTGTNGKTSVTRLLSAILHAHGLRTGTYTSPHLISYTERMVIDGVPIAEEEFAFSLGSAIDAAAGLSSDVGVFTEFELLTAAALSAFARAGALWAVLEVGMGGRWDATSVVAPRVSVITGVGLDHMDRLGSTREEIAADKACIIKTGSVAILGPGCVGVEQILLERAAKSGAPVVRVGLPGADVTWRVTSSPDAAGAAMVLDVDGALAPYTGLLVHAPSYQAPNVAVAIAAAEAALGQPLDEALLREALGEMTFPGRFELVRVVQPIVIDGAHNPEASAVLAGAVREVFQNANPVFVLGVMADKDAAGIVQALAPVSAGFVCTRSNTARAMAPAMLAEVVRNGGGVVLGIADSVAEALECAEPYSGAGLIVAGSIYVAGEARAILSAQ